MKKFNCSLAACNLWKNFTKISFPDLLSEQQERSIKYAY